MPGTAFGTFDSAIRYNGGTTYRGKGGIHESDSKAAGSADPGGGADRVVRQTGTERIGRGAGGNGEDAAGK